MFFSSPFWLWYRKKFLLPYRQKKAERTMPALIAWAEKLLGGKCRVTTPKNEAGKARRLRHLSNATQSVYVHWTAHPSVAGAFFHIGQHLHTAGIRVPRILHYDLQQHFFMLEDLGSASLSALPPKEFTEEILLAAAAALAEFHAKAQLGFDPAWCDKEPFNQERIYEYCTRYVRQWAQSGIVRPERSLLLRAEKDFRKLLDSANIPTAHHCLMHTDYHPGNIFWINNKIHIIDWDFARFGPAAMDLAKLFVSPSSSRQNTRRFRDQGIAAYLQAAGLSHAEQALFRRQLVIFEACWLVRHLFKYAARPGYPTARILSRSIRETFSSEQLAPFPALSKLMLTTAKSMVKTLRKNRQAGKSGPGPLPHALCKEETKLP